MRSKYLIGIAILLPILVVVMSRVLTMMLSAMYVLQASIPDFPAI